MNDEAEVESTSDKLILTHFNEFVNEITNNDEVKKSSIQESISFINKVQELPYLDNPVDGDIRYELFIRKIVAHVSSRLVVEGDEKMLDSRSTKSTVWVLRMFRTMIEDAWGMTIDERDDDGGEEQDDAVADIVEAFNSNGVTDLCLDLIADGVDIDVQREAVKLCVAMLFKEGGAVMVQTTIYNHLNNHPSHIFFKRVEMIIKDLISWHIWHSDVRVEGEDDPELPGDIIVIRFLQLMSEGHFLPNQNIMREQPNNGAALSVNLLLPLVDYLKNVTKAQTRTNTLAGIAVASTILEVLQGPCEGNQVFLACETLLIETLNRIMRNHPVEDCDEGEEIELQMTAIDIFQGLLEGQADKVAVYEKVLSVLHLDAIQTLAMPDDPDYDPANDSEDMNGLRIQCMVFLQMLCDFKPELKVLLCTVLY